MTNSKRLRKESSSSDSSSEESGGEGQGWFDDLLPKLLISQKRPLRELLRLVEQRYVPILKDVDSKGGKVLVEINEQFYDVQAELKELRYELPKKSEERANLKELGKWIDKILKSTSPYNSMPGFGDCQRNILSSTVSTLCFGDDRCSGWSTAVKSLKKSAKFCYDKSAADLHKWNPRSAKRSAPRDGKTYYKQQKK